MKYYVNINLNVKMTEKANAILNKTYTKIHNALVSIQSSNIGVSFPEYRVVLGTVIRLHGSKENLENLMNTEIMKSLNNCTVSEITEVPENISSYVKTSRAQAKMSNAKFNRLVRRGSISQEDKKKYRIEMLKKSMSNPFVVLQSGSNKNVYKRFFKIEKTNSLQSGEFDTFGTSDTASVPAF